jgi:hypothetical protein
MTQSERSAFEATALGCTTGDVRRFEVSLANSVLRNDGATKPVRYSYHCDVRIDFQVRGYRYN